MTRYLTSFPSSAMSHAAHAGAYSETKELSGGFALIDVSSRDEALKRAARIATGCRCPQEVREFMDDPEV